MGCERPARVRAWAPALLPALSGPRRARAASETPGLDLGSRWCELKSRRSGVGDGALGKAKWRGRGLHRPSQRK